MKKLRLDKNKIKSIENLSLIKIQGLSSDLTRELAPILTQILSKQHRETELFLKDFYIIRLVTLFEVYFTDWVIQLIDTYNLSVIELIGENPEYPDIKNYQTRNTITRGKIIAVNYNFQELSQVNYVFSKLLKIDFFESIKKIEFRDFANNKFLNNWDNFFQIFETRHEIVHRLIYHTKFSKKDIKDLDFALQFYLNGIDLLIAINLLKLNPITLKKENLQLFNDAEHQVNKGWIGFIQGPEQSITASASYVKKINPDELEDSTSWSSSYDSKKS